MKIKVLGTGCAKCKKLFEDTKKAVAELNLPHQVEYSTDVAEMIEMGILSSPVLVVDGKAVSVGSAPDVERLKKLLTTGSSENEMCACECKEGESCEGSCNCGGSC